MLRQCGVRNRNLIRLMSRSEAARLLGISANASKKEVKNGYLKMAKVYHPDNQETGDATKFKQLSLAQEILEKDVSPKPTYARPTGQSFHHRQTYHTDHAWKNSFNSVILCNPGNGGQRPYGRPEFENNSYRKTRARSFARENPYDDYKKFEDYMKNRQENAKRNKEAQAISNVFSVVFVIWAIYFMIRLFLHAEDMKNIERAVRIVAVRRGLPSPYVLDEYRSNLIRRRNGLEMKLHFLIDDDIEFLDFTGRNCSSMNSFLHIILNETRLLEKRF